MRAFYNSTVGDGKALDDDDMIEGMVERGQGVIVMHDGPAESSNL